MTTMATKTTKTTKTTRPGRVWPSTATAHRWRHDATAAQPTAIWSAWGGSVRVVVTDARVLEPVVELAMARMRAVERAASRFVVDSDLNWANVNSGRPVAVSRLLLDLVAAASDGARRPGGALRIGCGWSDVVVDRAAGLLTVPAGCSLDLGATAVVQTADWIARTARACFGADVLVEIGGDLTTAGPLPTAALDRWPNAA